MADSGADIAASGTATAALRARRRRNLRVLAGLAALAAVAGGGTVIAEDHGASHQGAPVVAATTPGVPAAAAALSAAPRSAGGAQPSSPPVTTASPAGTASTTVPPTPLTARSLLTTADFGPGHWRDDPYTIHVLVTPTQAYFCQQPGLLDPQATAALQRDFYKDTTGLGDLDVDERVEVARTPAAAGADVARVGRQISNCASQPHAVFRVAQRVSVFNGGVVRENLVTGAYPELVAIGRVGKIIVLVDDVSQGLPFTVKDVSVTAHLLEVAMTRASDDGGS